MQIISTHGAGSVYISISIAVYALLYWKKGMGDYEVYNIVYIEVYNVCTLEMRAHYSDLVSRAKMCFPFPEAYFGHVSGLRADFEM